MNTELSEALDLLEKEKGISKQADKRNIKSLSGI